jgi:hypothetical protein
MRIDLIARREEATWCAPGCEYNIERRGLRVASSEWERVMLRSRDSRWINLYKGVMLEFDRQKLPERISIAKGAIEERLARLGPSSDNQDERRSLAAASRNLRVLEFLH